MSPFPSPDAAGPRATRYTLISTPHGMHYLLTENGEYPRYVATFHGSRDGIDNAAADARDEAERHRILFAVNLDQALIAAAPDMREALEKADEVERLANLLACARNNGERNPIIVKLATAQYEYREARALYLLKDWSEDEAHAPNMNVQQNEEMRAVEREASALLSTLPPAPSAQPTTNEN